MNFIKEHLPEITASATAIAAVGASLLGVNEKILYSILVLAVLLIGRLADRVRRSQRSPDDEQKPSKTLRTNQLLPNTTKKFLGLKTNLVIVGDGESQRIFEELRDELQTIDDDLDINDFVSDSRDRDLQRGQLLDVLAGADAVIVVRTHGLEKQPWIYDVVESWAGQNSNAPVLVIDKIESSGAALQLNPIPERFYFIPDHQASLPWRLLKRASERSLAWRNQASFNRSIGSALFILGLSGLVIGYVTNANLRRRDNELVAQQKRDSYAQLQNIYTVIAKHTKEDFQEITGDKSDDQLNASYWLRYQGTYYLLASSEEILHRNWRSDKPSIIGCVLASPNRTVQWEEKNKDRPSVMSFTDVRIPVESNCGYGDQGQRQLKAIVCASYSESADPGPDNIVGVCMYSESENTKLITTSPDFIKKRTREFYEAVYPLLRDQKIVPQ